MAEVIEFPAAEALTPEEQIAAAREQAFLQGQLEGYAEGFQEGHSRGMTRYHERLRQVESHPAAATKAETALILAVAFPDLPADLLAEFVGRAVISGPGGREAARDLLRGIIALRSGSASGAG